MTEYLYGLPGAEYLYDDPGTVWETQIDGQDEDDGPWIIEQRTVRPAIDSVPTAARILDRIVEWIGDDDFAPDDDGRSLDAIAASPEVLGAAEKLREAIADKITWHWAGDLVATHEITIVSGAPWLDGEPMYRTVQP